MRRRLFADTASEPSLDAVVSPLGLTSVTLAKSVVATSDPPVTWLSDGAAGAAIRV